MKRGRCSGPSDEDVSGLALALGDGGEISGRVIIEGGDPKSLLATMRVMLESEAGRMRGFRMEGGEVLEDRTFSIRNVMEGAYRLRVFFQLGNIYLKSARVQGEDAPETYGRRGSHYDKVQELGLSVLRE